MKKKRSFLKWAGGKYQLVDKIKDHLPEGHQLIEPFVGAGSIFLNTHYKNYLLSDINNDLITLFNTLKTNSPSFIKDARKLFITKTNNKETFYLLRKEFNQLSDGYQRSLLFLYLNRHCYNGLCRYNSNGEFNVPFGQYDKPYFPEKEMHFFAEKAQNAEFICENYPETMAKADKNSIIYCDPPYVPLSKTANFTAYHKKGFTDVDQYQLALYAEQITNRHHIPIIISNHDTELTRFWYKEAKLYTIKTRRYISRNKETRFEINELLAVFYSAMEKNQ